MAINEAFAKVIVPATSSYSSQYGPRITWAHVVDDSMSVKAIDPLSEQQMIDLALILPTLDSL
jgi:hypothetical protein